MPDLELSFESGETSLSVRRFVVREGLSRPFVVWVEARSPEPSLALGAIVSRGASFRVTHGLAGAALGGVRRWTGICTRIVQTLAEPTGLSTYELWIEPDLRKLRERRGYRIHQHRSIPDILDALLGEWAITPVWRLDKNRYPKLDYKAQYGETDEAFAHRLLEEAGITYSFAEEERGSVITFDDAPHAADPRASGPIRWVESANDAAEIEHVSELHLLRAVRPGAYVIRDVDYRRPDQKLFAEAPKAPGNEAALEQYRYEPGAFLVHVNTPSDTPAADDHGVARHDDSAGKARAERALEAARADRWQVRCTTNVIDLRPGVVFSIDGHPRADLSPARRLLVTAFGIQGVVGEAWTMACEAAPADVPHRPALVTPKPRVEGVQSAIVVGPAGQEIHTDEFGRVRVQFPWDREGKRDDFSSCWIRVSQGWAGATYGMMLLPRVRQEVLVAFLDGDPDQPILAGRLYDVTSPTPYKLPDDKTKSAWKSDSSLGSEGYNEILLEDKKGDELFSQKVQKNQRTLIKNDETITVVSNREKLVERRETDTTIKTRFEVTEQDRVEIDKTERVVWVEASKQKKVSPDEVEQTLGEHQLRVGRDEHVLIKRDKRERVVNDSHVTVCKSRNESVGAQSLTAGGLQEKVGGRHALDAAIDVHFKAGSAFIGEGASDVTIKGGGGFIRIGAGGVTIQGSMVYINAGGSPGSALDAKPGGPARPKEAEVQEPPPPKLTPPDVQVKIKNEGGLKGGCHFIPKGKSHTYKALGSPPDGTFRWKVSGNVSIVGADTNQTVEVQGSSLSGSLEDSRLTVEYTAKGITARDEIPLTVYEIRTINAKYAPKRPQNAVPDASSTSDSRVVDASTMTVTRSGGEVKLSADIAPKGVPVTWDVERAADPAGSGEPTHVEDGSDDKRTVHTDATGTFHIMAFVDCDGDGRRGAAEGGLTFNLQIIDPCMQQVFDALEVDDRIDETISNASAGNEEWNGSYNWQSTFRLEVTRRPCAVTVTVKIKTIGTVSEAQKAGWKAAIEAKWNNKAKLVCADATCPGSCAGGYPISVVIEYVASGAHYEVKAITPGGAAGPHTGLGGTSSMTKWGVNDVIDTTHEFGHMLGNTEEYFTTNGVDFTFGGTKSGFRDADGGIMNNPSNNPRLENYERIRRYAAQVMGGASCVTRPR